MTMTDENVEEIRENRMAHTRKFNGDLALNCEDLRKIQQEFPQRIVRGKSNKLPTTNSSSERVEALQTR